MDRTDFQWAGLGDIDTARSVERSGSEKERLESRDGSAGGAEAGRVERRRPRSHFFAPSTAACHHSSRRTQLTCLLISGH